jgi:hypothetical protein
MARLVPLARLLQAVAVLGLHLLPDLGQRRERQRHARAFAGRERPVDDRRQLLLALGIGEQPLLALGEVHAPQADVVVAADGGHRRPLERQHRVQERQVLLLELLLQRDGARAHDHRSLPLVRVGVQHGGQQVRERLADAGAGFGAEVPLRRERLLDRRRQLELFAADLVAGKAARDRPVAAQQFGDAAGHAEASATSVVDSSRHRRGLSSACTTSACSIGAPGAVASTASPSEVRRHTCCVASRSPPEPSPNA